MVNSRGAAAFLTATLAAAMAIGPSATAASATPLPLTLCPGTSTLCETVASTIDIPVTAHVVCEVASTSALTPAYIYVEKSTKSGYAPASSLPVTGALPDCSTDLGLQAALWALRFDGTVKVPVIARDGTSATYWSSWCWLFTHDSWLLGAGQDSRFSGASAQQTAAEYQGAGLLRAPIAMPPRGSLVFFVHSPSGHAAVSLGDGWVESTQGATEAARLPIVHERIAKVGFPEQGYVLPADV